MEQMKKIILEKSTLLTLLVTSNVFMGGRAFLQACRDLL